MVVFALISGDPGPMAFGANVVSHFQLPSIPLYAASSSGEGFGIMGAPAAGAAPAGAGAAAGAAAGGLAFSSAKANELATSSETSSDRKAGTGLVVFMGILRAAP